MCRTRSLYYPIYFLLSISLTDSSFKSNADSTAQWTLIRITWYVPMCNSTPRPEFSFPYMLYTIAVNAQHSFPNQRMQSNDAFYPYMCSCGKLKEKSTSGLLLATAALCIGDASKWTRLEASKVQRRPRDCTSVGIIFITAADAEEEIYLLPLFVHLSQQALRYAPRSTRAPGRLHTFEIDALMSLREQKRNATRLVLIGVEACYFHAVPLSFIYLHWDIAFYYHMKYLVIISMYLHQLLFMYKFSS